MGNNLIIQCLYPIFHGHGIHFQCLELGKVQETAKCILSKSNLRENELTAKHADWVESFLPQYRNINENNVTEILEKEAGLVFVKVLECAGVFKHNKKGHDAFLKFINVL